MLRHIFLLSLLASLGQLVFAHDTPLRVNSIGLDTESVQALQKKVESNSELKICDDLSLKKSEITQNRIDVGDLNLDFCSIVNPTKELYTKLSTTYNRTRLRKSDNDKDKDKNTAHQIDLTYSGVPIRGKTKSDGTLSFGASLNSFNNGGELNVYGAFFHNKNGIYRPHFVPYGSSFGGGLWASDSELKGSDVGSFARWERLMESKTVFDKSTNFGYGVDLKRNDSVLNRQSNLTVSLGGDFSIRHGDTVDENVALSLNVDYSDLESEAFMPNNAFSGVLSVSGGLQLLPSIYLEADLGLFRVWNDPIETLENNKTHNFLSIAFVFRKPQVVDEGVPFFASKLRGMRKLGGSAFGQSIFNILAHAISQQKTNPDPG